MSKEILSHGGKRETYSEFVEKFEAKKTTDDCFTPKPVYDYVADYVADRYDLDRASFVRPFWPGGDYENFDYPDDCVVVDNPPFSLLARIVRFFVERGIRYWLFAPTLTLFNGGGPLATAVPCGCSITYDNGAKVNTSFLTNLESHEWQIVTLPDFVEGLQDVADAYAKTTTKNLPKYVYDPHVVTAATLGCYARQGVSFRARRSECVRVSRLDCQKTHKKGIFGSGFIVSDRLAEQNERARIEAERARIEAERARAQRWELSDRERDIVKQLNKNTKD